MESTKPGSNALADELVNEAIDTLGATVGNFANRIQRKLKEQEAKDEVAQRETDERHARMLKAMNTIRKALQETCKINLGDRFSLDFDVDDFKGWPRLRLDLVDSLRPEDIVHGLVVSAHDRKDLGTVEIRLRSDELLGRVQLKDPTEFERIPSLLKKSVRSFLDQVAEYVLKKIQAKESEEEIVKPIATQELDPTTQQLHTEELFTDEQQFGDDNQVGKEGELNPIDDIAFE